MVHLERIKGGGKGVMVLGERMNLRENTMDEKKDGLLVEAGSIKEMKRGDAGRRAHCEGKMSVRMECCWDKGA